MTLKNAFKVLEDHSIVFRDYFDLVAIETRDLRLHQAIERVKTYITMGV